MANYHKLEQRRKQRGEFCVIDKCKYDGDYSRERSRRGLCGCGNRTPPPRKHKDRMVRRSLQRQAQDLIAEEATGR